MRHIPESPVQLGFTFETPPPARITVPADVDHPLLRAMQLVLENVWRRLEGGRVCRIDEAGHLLPALPGDAELLVPLDEGELIWWTPKQWHKLNVAAAERVKQARCGWAPRLTERGRIRYGRWARRYVPQWHGELLGRGDVASGFSDISCHHSRYFTK